VIAEEVSLFRDALVALCESGGKYKAVGSASTGEEAWGLIQRARPMLAVVSLTLPGFHPFEMARRLSESPGLRLEAPARCILLARTGDRKNVLEALRSGAQGYVLKTDAGQQLFDCLDHVLEGGVYVSPSIDLRSLFNPSYSAHGDDPLTRLSSREYQVFSMLVDGVRPKEIAARLELSPKTVDTYRASLMKKLDIHDVPALVKFAIQRRLI
jgi:DNA-binding NarL/FixJ family response regulator